MIKLFRRLFKKEITLRTVEKWAKEEVKDEDIEARIETDQFTIVLSHKAGERLWTGGIGIKSEWLSSWMGASGSNRNEWAQQILENRDRLILDEYMAINEELQYLVAIELIAKDKEDAHE